MKRPLTPVTEYEGHASYPSCEEAGLSRRSFLKTTACTAAVTVAGGALWAGEADATPGPKDKRQRITIYLNRYNQIGTSGLRAKELIVFTGNKGLARFLQKSSEQRRVRQQLMKRLGKILPKALYDGRKLYRLERSLGAIVAGQYRKRTGRAAPQPDVMLNVTQYHGFVKMGGVIVRPRLRFPPKRTP